MKLRDQDRHTFGMMDRRTAIHAGNFGSKALLDASNIITVLTGLGANLNNISANVVSGSTLTPYLWNNATLEWVPISAETPNILPDGITVEGSLTQSSNDLTYSATLAWAWRVSGTEYTSVQTVISVPPATAGNRRRDLIYGNTSGAILRIAGNEVPSEETAILPSLPADTIALTDVDVLDTGISSFIEFALSSFVRFDINNQALSPQERQNARTNIQALSKDTNDTRTGSLTQNGAYVQNSNGWTMNGRNWVLQFPNDTHSSTSFIIRNDVATDPGGLFMTERGSTIIRARGDSVTDYYIVRFQGSNALQRVEINNQGIWANQRSVSENYLLRRDENYLSYPITVNVAGELSNVALADGVGMIVFGVDVTGVTGIISNNLDEKELIIWSENASGITLNGEDVGSDANNRFSDTFEIGYRVPVKLIYRAGSINRWFLLSGGGTTGDDTGFVTLTGPAQNIDSVKNFRYSDIRIRKNDPNNNFQRNLQIRNAPDTTPEVVVGENVFGLDINGDLFITKGNADGRGIVHRINPTSYIVLEYRNMGGVPAFLSDLEEWVAPPTTSSSSGTKGDKSFDANFIYFCVDTDTWERVAKDTSAW